MSIEEEIKMLENALSGALLVPSECAFVNTEIIKICLETLKTYESWELLIKHEITEQIRAEVIEFISDKLIYPLLDEYDRSLWENISHIELAEEWVKILNDNPYPKVENHTEARKRDLREWITNCVEQLKKGKEE